MKNIIRLSLLLMLILPSQSCQNILEEDLSSVFSIDNLKSEGDIVAALAPVYRRLATVHNGPHYLRTPTYGADDITTWWAGNKAPLRVFDGFDYGNGENSEIIWLNHGWDGYWQVIYAANTLIEGLKTATAPPAVVASADGEARFFRALSYFNLVRTHGNVPILLDGVAPTGEEQRATVLENYKQIESDLLIAEKSLPAPTAVKNVGRVSNAAAKTLLADLYLTWGGWPVKDPSKYALAASKAKEVIDMNYFTLLPIKDLWLLSNQNSKEAIFSVQYSETENMPNVYPETFSFHEAGGWSDAYPELQFFKDFPEGARKEATFATDIPQRGVSGGKIITLNPATKVYTASQRLHPMYKKFTISENLNYGVKTAGFRAIELYRYAEVLLIYAEAQARVGQNASSIEALNQVRRRAKGLDFKKPDPTVDVTTATPNQIIDEKGWELAGEYKRWFDLVRSERVEEIAAKRDPGEQVPLVRKPTKANYIAPIPFQTISASKLQQNPAGFKIQ